MHEALPGALSASEVVYLGPPAASAALGASDPPPPDAFVCVCVCVKIYT